MKKQKPTKKNNHAPENVKQLAKSIRWTINGCTLMLVFTFAWLKFQDAEWLRIAKDLPSDLVYKTALVAYLSSWDFGLLFDTNVQEPLYQKSSNVKRKMPLGFWITAIFLTGVFGIMCWVQSYETFAMVLGVFLVINIITWLYLTKFMLRPIVSDLEKDHRRNQEFIELEKLKVVYHSYLSGSWQWFRFAAGFTVLAIIVASKYTFLGSLISFHLGGISYDLELSMEVAGFVFIVESWIWFERFRMMSSLEILSSIGSTYKLTEEIIA